MVGLVYFADLQAVCVYCVVGGWQITKKCSIACQHTVIYTVLFDGIVPDLHSYTIFTYHWGHRYGRPI